MPAEFYSIAPVDEVTKDGLDRLVAELNARFSDITVKLAELQGFDGMVATQLHDLDMGGKRITNVGATSIDTDVPNRQELTQRALYRSRDSDTHVTNRLIDARAGVKVPWALAAGYVVPLDQLQTGFIDLTSDQDIPGNKTFSGTTTFSGTNNVTGTMAVSGQLRYSATTPAAIAANTNDYNLGNGVFYRISATAPFNITGFAGGANGRVMILVNVGANAITLTNLDAASAAANQVLTGTGASIVMAQDDTVAMIYDATTANWRVWNVH